MFLRKHLRWILTNFFTTDQVKAKSNMSQKTSDRITWSRGMRQQQEVQGSRLLGEMSIMYRLPEVSSLKVILHQAVCSSILSP